MVGRDDFHKGSSQRWTLTHLEVKEDKEKLGHWFSQLETDRDTACSVLTEDLSQLPAESRDKEMGL